MGFGKGPGNHVQYGCEDNMRISSPVVLNNKTRYVQYRIAGWMAMKAGRMRAKALGVVARGRS